MNDEICSNIEANVRRQCHKSAAREKLSDHLKRYLFEDAIHECLACLLDRHKSQLFSLDDEQIKNESAKISRNYFAREKRKQVNAQKLIQSAKQKFRNLRWEELK